MSDNPHIPNSDSPATPPPPPVPQPAPGVPSAPQPEPSAPSSKPAPAAPSAPSAPLDMAGQMVAAPTENAPVTPTYTDQQEPYQADQPKVYQEQPKQAAPQAVAPVATSQPGSRIDIKAELIPIWNTFKHIFSGHAPAGFESMERAQYSIHVVLAGYSLLCGLIGAALASNQAAFSGDILSWFTKALDINSQVGISITWGAWLKIFFVVAIINAIILALRALEVMLSTRLSAGTMSYSQAARIVATAYVPWVIIMLPLWFFFALPLGSFSAVILALIALLLPMCMYLAELLIYVGLNRSGNCGRSPLIPHACLTGVVGIIAAVLLITAMVNVAPTYSDYIYWGR